MNENKAKDEVKKRSLHFFRFLSFLIRVHSRNSWLILHHFFFGELGTFWSDFASDQFFGEAFCKAETIS